MKVKDITTNAILLAIAIVLSIVEGFIPSIGVPGVKFGLANIVILITLYAYGWHYALAVNLLRVFLVSLLRGTIFQIGFFMSLTGALFSLAIMIFCKLVIKKLNIITVSVLGAFAHVVGQILVAVIYLETTGMFFYLPILTITSVATGIIVGFIANRCLKIPIFHASVKTNQ